MTLKIERIALLADLSSMDDILLKYIKKLDKMFDFKQLEIIHWVEIEHIPAELRETLDAQGRSLTDILTEELSEQIEKHFGAGNSSVNIQIRQDKSISDLISYLDSDSFDLMLVGKKSYYEGSGIMSSKLVRLSKTPCLFIPEMSHTNFDSILAPIDFSKYSENVIEMALTLSKKAGSSLELIHVIKMSMQFFPYIKNTDELKNDLRKKAIDKFNILKKNKFPQSLECSMLIGGDQHISKIIYDYALEEGIGLIILGSKGNHDDSDFLIGSVTERLIANDKIVPVLVINC